MMGRTDYWGEKLQHLVMKTGNRKQEKGWKGKLERSNVTPFPFLPVSDSLRVHVTSLPRSISFTPCI